MDNLWKTETDCKCGTLYWICGLWELVSLTVCSVPFFICNFKYNAGRHVMYDMKLKVTQTLQLSQSPLSLTYFHVFDLNISWSDSFFPHCNIQLQWNSMTFYCFIKFTYNIFPTHYLIFNWLLQTYTV